MKSDKIKIRQVSCKGLGIVAISDIDEGELLLSEEPLILIDDWSPQHLLSSWSSLPKHQQDIFLQLSNCHKQTGMNPLVGIALTNMIPVNTRSGQQSQWAVFQHMARINHSCDPNCNHYQIATKSSCCEEVRALQKIKAGEEITISYRNQLQKGFITREERKKHLLENFGFDCDCKLCQYPADVSENIDEKRQTALENKIDLLDSSLKYSDKETLKKSIKWLSLIIEAQYNIDYHLDPIFLCHNAAVALQNEKAVNHWAKLGSKIATVSRGEYSRNAMYFNASLK